MSIIAFPWYGGKARFLLILQALIPEHRIWCEPFMGSAVFTLNHIISQREIINDLDFGLVCFFKTLQDEKAGQELIDRILKMERTKPEFKKALADRNAWDEKQKGKEPQYINVERALNEFTVITQSYNSTRGNYTDKNKKSETYLIKCFQNLPEVRRRLKNVEIWNKSALDVIRELKDNKDAFLFLDPPYEHDKRNPGATKVYKEEMSENDHKELAELIADAKCKIILCGYRYNDVMNEEPYDEYLLKQGGRWKCYKLADTKKTAAPSKDGKKPPAKEFIWVNYTLPDYAKYYISMKEYGTKGD